MALPADRCARARNAPSFPGSCVLATVGNALNPLYHLQFLLECRETEKPPLRLCVPCRNGLALPACLAVGRCRLRSCSDSASIAAVATTPSSERHASCLAAACMPSKTALASEAGNPLGSCDRTLAMTSGVRAARVRHQTRSEPDFSDPDSIKSTA
jgi:hypothetical protein